MVPGTASTGPHVSGRAVGCGRRPCRGHFQCPHRLSAPPAAPPRPVTGQWQGPPRTFSDQMGRRAADVPAEGRGRGPPPRWPAPGWDRAALPPWRGDALPPRAVSAPLCFAAEAGGGAGDHAPHAALRGVVRGLHARLDRKSPPRPRCVLSAGPGACGRLRCRASCSRVALSSGASDSVRRSEHGPLHRPATRHESLLTWVMGDTGQWGPKGA